MAQLEAACNGRGVVASPSHKDGSFESAIRTFRV